MEMDNVRLELFEKPIEAGHRVRKMPAHIRLHCEALCLQLFTERAQSRNRQEVGECPCSRCSRHICDTSISAPPTSMLSATCTIFIGPSRASNGALLRLFSSFHTAPAHDIRVFYSAHEIKDPDNQIHRNQQRHH